jgi:L-aspartate oxidase
MWEKAGLLRDASGLLAAQQSLDALVEELPETTNRQGIELRNLLAVGQMIVASALAREESRGAHYRNDFPKRDDKQFGRHSVMRGEGISFQDL